MGSYLSDSYSVSCAQPAARSLTRQQGGVGGCLGGQRASLVIYLLQHRQWYALEGAQSLGSSDRCLEGGEASGSGVAGGDAWIRSTLWSRHAVAGTPNVPRQYCNVLSRGTDKEGPLRHELWLGRGGLQSITMLWLSCLTSELVKLQWGSSPGMTSELTVSVLMTRDLMNLTSCSTSRQHSISSLVALFSCEFQMVILGALKTRKKLLSRGWCACSILPSFIHSLVIVVVSLDVGRFPSTLSPDIYHFDLTIHVLLTYPSAAG